jgi:nucleoside-diphosphate-sugar epimerase
MKIFVAGATGALGRVLVPQLVAGGHEVVGLTRTPSKQDLLRDLGARPAVADALDPDAVARAVAEAEPEVIVHQLTALSRSIDMRHLERDFAETNRLRTEGTDHLLAAGRAVGVRRFVAQSFAGWPSARTGGPVKTEADPLDPTPPAGLRTMLAALRHLEDAVTGAGWTEGVVLRYGGFYGPGTSFGVKPEGEHVALIRKRKFPVVGNGAGMWSFIHIEDAAAATVAAVEHGKRGIYNVVDDEPAPVSVWLPAAAETLGAKPPRRVPRWLGRIAAGEAATVMMTEVRGASNEKAKRELGWRPRYSSWREGFAGETRNPAHPAEPGASALG